MKSLFIIGNGFDLSHGLKTSYEDFYKYLQNEYPTSTADEFIQPNVYMLPDGEETVSDIESVSYLMRIISEVEGDKWKNVEETLGYLDFSEFFNYLQYELDEDGDVDPWKQSRINENIASNLIIPTLKVSDYFSAWINTIIIYNTIPIKKDFVKLLNRNSDLFLSFNYTETLEIIYGIENICHIHGKKDEELLFGHGNNIDYYEENMSKFIGSENALDKIQIALKKDTSMALQKHMHFFNKINSTVDKVFSYGFSFSEIDSIYIQQICNRLSNPSVCWYLNDYNSISERQEHINFIKSCAYTGKFETFHIN